MGAGPSGAEGGVDAAVDELFAVEPPAFVEARNALAKRLRAEGEREAAGWVAMLRRPTAVAWALNQLARRERGQVELLLRRDEQIRELLRSPSDRENRGSELRAAMDERRDTVRNLASLASAILAGAGHKPTSASSERIFETLQAVATDATAREALRLGRLQEDAQAGGFSADAAPAEGGAADREASGDVAARERLQEARRRAAQRADEAEDLRRALRRLEHDAEESERLARRARKEAERTAAAYEKATVAAEEAARALRDLEKPG